MSHNKSRHFSEVNRTHKKCWVHVIILSFWYINLAIAGSVVIKPLSPDTSITFSQSSIKIHKAYTTIGNFSWRKEAFDDDDDCSSHHHGDKSPSCFLRHSRQAGQKRQMLYFFVLVAWAHCSNRLGIGGGFELQAFFIIGLAPGSSNWDSCYIGRTALLCTHLETRGEHLAGRRIAKIQGVPKKTPFQNAVGAQQSGLG